MPDRQSRCNLAARNAGKGQTLKTTDLQPLMFEKQLWQMQCAGILLGWPSMDFHRGMSDVRDYTREASAIRSTWTTATVSQHDIDGAYRGSCIVFPASTMVHTGKVMLLFTGTCISVETTKQFNVVQPT